MGLVRWLRSLFAQTNVQPHDYVHPPLLFPQLDLTNTQKRLRLVEEGVARGKNNLPGQLDDSLDLVENQIVTYIRSEVGLVEDKLSQQMRAYNDRQASLTITTRLNQLVASADDTVTQFLTCVRQGKDDLYQIKKDFVDINKEFARFKTASGLTRSPHYPRSKVLHWSVVMALVLIETTLNGTLLAVGNALGLVGGLSEALIIAVLNVTIGLLAGAICLRYLSHRNSLAKVVAVVAIAVWLSLSVAFNLTVAHYRAALGGDYPADASRIALEEVRKAPLGIQSVQGWLLFALGVGFNILAAFDGWKMDDPYPGYGPLARRRGEAQTDYILGKQNIEDELVRIKNESIGQLDTLSAEMEFKVEDYRNIDANRKSLVDSFTAHVAYLEQCCNQLLSVYRQANIGARTSPGPQHFSQTWSLDVKPVVPIPTRDQDMFERLQTSIHQITDTRQKILTGFTESMQAFHALEELDTQEAPDATEER